AAVIGNDSYVRGIFTAGQSDVSVMASGDVNVAGSRIAAFNGGNIFVESLTGNVNAGSGALSQVAVTEINVNPGTFAVTVKRQPISGSGILATTLPDSPANETVGNIKVLTP